MILILSTSPIKSSISCGSQSLVYLDSLKDLCSSLSDIHRGDIEEIPEEIDAYLRYGALFYFKDSAAMQLMRVLNYVNDIYPPRLKEMVRVKEEIDHRYPFKHLFYIYKKQKRFIDFNIGFPLLTAFYKDITPRWVSQVISLLDRLFTAQQIPVNDIIRNVNQRVHNTLRYTYDLRKISEIVLNLTFTL